MNTVLQRGPGTSTAWRQAAIIAWAAATLVVALLPEGAGASPRALNAVIFLSLGPALPLALILARWLPPGPMLVVSLGSSLAILVLSSQLLLLLGSWRAWAVTALVAAATIVLAAISYVMDHRE